jgi:dipeptidyl aminopeptidase/acylaminoacyl peptidase
LPRWLRVFGPLAAGGVLIVGVLALLRVYRAARTEGSCFRPRRGRVAVPAVLSGVGTRRDVAFEACDRVELRGWYFPSRNRAAVILAHGSEADRSQLAPEAKALVDVGFGVLAFDFPGHGESGGRVTFGRCEVLALRAAAAFAAAQPDVDPTRIGALGLSVGAALVAVAAAEEPGLRSIVLISPFADSEEQTQNEVKGLNWLAQWTTFAIDRHYMRDGPLRPIDAVGALGGRELLVVAVVDDTTVPLFMSEKVYGAAAAQKQMFVLPSGGHANVDAIVAGTCGERILEFWRESLLAAR